MLMIINEEDKEPYHVKNIAMEAQSDRDIEMREGVVRKYKDL